MRIGFIKAYLNVGGVEVNQLELARLLASKGFDVDVWAWGAGSASWMAQRYADGNVRLQVGLPDDPNVYDIIVAVMPSLYFPLLEQYRGKLYCIIGNRSSRYYSKKIEERLDLAGCICDSQDTVNFVNDITPGMNCFKWFYMKSPEILDCERNRRAFDLPEDATVFGTMCNLSRKKRVDRIISSYGTAISRGMKNTHLAIAGHGRVAGKLRAQAAAELPAGSYTFVGHQPTYHTGAFLSTLDCFLTSHQGNQGGICMCANEAVGAGCYLIVGDVGGIKENILAPEFGILLDYDLLDDQMPQEMLTFSVKKMKHLNDTRDRIKCAYRDMYEQQKSVSEWISC